MKKVLSIMFAVILAFVVTTSAYADNKIMYTGKMSDGTVVNYYLDENLMPYIIHDGEKMGIALPLEHLKVTDPVKLQQLNAAVSIYSINGTGFGDGGVTETVSFGNSSTYTTQQYTYNGTTGNQMRLHTYDYDKDLFASKKISFSYYYSDLTNSGTWYSYSYSDCSTASTNGFGIAISPRAYPNMQIEINKPSGVRSFTMHLYPSSFN